LSSNLLFAGPIVAALAVGENVRLHAVFGDRRRHRMHSKSVTIGCAPIIRTFQLIFGFTVPKQSASRQKDAIIRYFVGSDFQLESNVDVALGFGGTA
jgi:hypothetical protein